jgi:hypothetical protein
MLDVSLTGQSTFCPLGRYAPVAVNSGLCPETLEDTSPLGPQLDQIRD